jgi:protein CpxP
MDIKKIARVSLFTLIAIAAFAVATVQPAEAHKRGKGHGAMIQKIIKKLDLTDAQKTRIKEIVEGFKTQNATLIEELKTAREQMRDARKSGDKARVEQLKAANQQKMEQMKAAREQMKEQILAVLTPEQRAQLEKMKENRKGKREMKQGRERGAAKRGQRDATLD